MRDLIEGMTLHAHNIKTKGWFIHLVPSLSCVYVYLSQSDQNVLVMFVVSLTVKDWPPSELKFLETMQILTNDVCTVADSYLVWRWAY